MNNQTVYDVIIIGAGAAGLGAAAYLQGNVKNTKLSYLVLQARNRIGGRILSQNLSGVNVQLGATQIHIYDENNPMYKYVKQFNIKQADLQRNKFHVIIDGDSGKQIDQSIVDQADSKFQEFIAYLRQFSSKQPDLSVSQIFNRFTQQNLNDVDTQVRQSTFLRILQIQNYQATDLRKISAKFLDLSIQEGKDFLPSGGYRQILQKIANQFEIKVQFNKIVELISYQKQKTLVKCEDGTIYWCKKIISSLPLGILKSKRVQFEPQLPKQYLLSIQRLGFNIFNKVIIQFETNFWGSSQWIKIISKKRGNCQFIFNQSRKGRNILSFLIAAAKAHQYDKENDAVILGDLLDILKAIYGNENVKLKQYTITRWGKEQYSLGSYTSFHVGSSPQDCYRLRTPMLQTLWFVGQHCWAECLGSAHGALKTGQIAAQQVIESLKTIKKGPLY